MVYYAGFACCKSNAQESPSHFSPESIYRAVQKGQPNKSLHTLCGFCIQMSVNLSRTVYLPVIKMVCEFACVCVDKEIKNGGGRWEEGEVEKHCANHQ